MESINRTLFVALSVSIIFIGVYFIFQGRRELEDIESKVLMIARETPSNQGLLTSTFLVIHINTKYAYSQIIGGMLFFWFWRLCIANYYI